MGKMYELGLLDCEDRPSIEENFARIKESCDGPVLDENGKLLNEVLPEGYPYEETVTAEVVQKEWTVKFDANESYKVSDVSIKPFDGKDVIVYVGNERFVTKCENAGGAYSILLGGNFVELAENLTDIGMTVLIRPDKGEAATYEVKVCTLEEQTTVVPMAEKFLPPDIGGNPVLDENGKLLNAVLPEGYPYDAGSFYYNNSGYQDGDELINGVFFKVSDDVIPYEDIVGAEVDFNGTKIVVNESFVVQHVEGEYCFLGECGAVVYKDNVIFNINDKEFNFPTAGLYMPSNKNGNISITKNAVVPMATEFLPKITIIQDGYDDAAMGVAAAYAESFTCTANATFAEVMQMMQTKTVPPIELYYCGLLDAVIGHAEGGSINLHTNTEGALGLAVYFNLSTICYRVVWFSNDEITMGVWTE